MQHQNLDLNGAFPISSSIIVYVLLQQGLQIGWFLLHHTLKHMSFIFACNGVQCAACALPLCHSSLRQTNLKQSTEFRRPGAWNENILIQLVNECVPH